MKIAFVPWDDSVMHDQMFTPKYTGYLDSHIIFAKELKKIGYEIHTIDVYTDLQVVDLFLFSKLNYKWLKRVMDRNLLSKAVYCSAEPPVVVPWNCAEGYMELLHIFSNIMTWNDDLIDNRRIFKRNIPYFFTDKIGEVDFDKRKLLTNISGNKSSNHMLELYSEREKVINWFEQNQPDQFDLYGLGWDKGKHPSYRGTIYDKTAVYHDYRFALCLENMYDVRGYITEKICDCFSAGIVPIYLGAKDITDFVPQDCFIDYQRFSNIAELYSFLTEMPENTYKGYIDAIHLYLNNHDNTPFSEQKMAEYVKHIYESGYKGEPELSASDRKKVNYAALKECFVEKKSLFFINMGLLKRKILGRKNNAE